jgi:hypothetical protein
MATMASGSVTFNNVSDEELSKATEFKSKHEKVLEFDPTQMQKARNINPGLYDNMTIKWNSNESYAVAHELISLLLGT